MDLAVRSGRLVVRLAVVFAAVAALTAALAGVLIAATLDARFERYVQQNLTWEIVVRHWLRQLACHPASRRKLAVEPQSVIPRVSPSGD